MTAVAAPATPVWRRRSLRLLAGDLLIWVVLQAVGVGSLAHTGEDRWWAWLLVQLVLLPLLTRRARPVASFWFAGAVALVQLIVGLHPVAAIALLVDLYTVARHRSRQHAVAAAVALEVGVVLASVRFAPADGIVGSIVFLSGLVAAAFFIGTNLQTRRAYLASVEDRARRLERERDQQAQLAATAERTRIARELHDIVAHSLSVVITLADGAVAAGRSDPTQAEQAMRDVAATGRRALGEMRRLLGVLRDDSGGAVLGPQPTLADLDDLVEQVRGTGLPVTVVVRGAPQPLPATAQTTVYRVVQEALTNTLKHAAEVTKVSVSLNWHADTLTISIHDDGSPSPPPDPERGGHGLEGMRERVELFGGSLTVGPHEAGGWQVRAVLPVGDEP